MDLMDSDSVSAVVGAVRTLLGVVPGALGTLGAARVQLRGAIAQADAVLAQADTTYRAALDQAHAAQRAVHEQWRREIRRDAYAAFVAALDRLEELVSRPELLEDDSGGEPDPLTLATRAVRATHAVVELEGPESLALLAHTARERGLTACDHARRLAPRAGALRVLGVATDGGPAGGAEESSPAALARAAHRALTRLREAAFHLDAGRVDQAAFDAARQRAADSLDACGLLTPGQRRALLGDPSWEGALRAGSEHADALNRLTAARTDFVAAARALLDTAGAAPEAPAPPRHPRRP